jgi:hypothetical protein
MGGSKKENSTRLSLSRAARGRPYRVPVKGELKGSGPFVTQIGTDLLGGGFWNGVPSGCGTLRRDECIPYLF